MTDIRFTDAATMGALRQTSDGYLVGDVRCARTGCMTYPASELGLVGDHAMTVYRPETTVFSKDSLATFAGKPVTIGHPPVNVTADTWREYAVGDVGDEIARDGEFVKVPFRLMDAAAITAVQGGTREISMGYTTQIEITDGIAPDGTAYQAVQTGPIRINHLAIVAKARGGEELRIGDSAAHWGASPIIVADTKGNTMSLQTVVLGDQAAQVAIADAPKVEAFKADMAKRITDMETAHAETIATKDADLAKAEAARDAEKAKVLSDADIDKRVQDRAELIGQAKAVVADVKTTGLSDAAIRKAVVVAKLGDAMADKTEAYIDARFDILAEDAANADPFANALADTKGATKVLSLDAAYTERNASLANAWQDQPKKEA